MTNAAPSPQVCSLKWSSMRIVADRNSAKQIAVQFLNTSNAFCMPDTAATHDQLTKYATRSSRRFLYQRLYRCRELRQYLFS